MMLSVLVWLAMQGQTTYGQRSYCVIGKNYAANCTQAELDEYRRRKLPAEHVIEIKTVREKETICNWETHYACREAKEPCCISVTKRVTRELWIDGVRWGVVKGLE